MYCFNATLALQIVFETLQAEGSDLCFETHQDLFEFIVDDEMGKFYLSELIIFDGCNQGLSIFIKPQRQMLIRLLRKLYLRYI